MANETAEGLRKRIKDKNIEMVMTPDGKPSLIIDYDKITAIIKECKKW